MLKLKGDDVMKIPFAPKTLLINDCIYLHFYYANNAGRGTNNCSIIATSNKTRTGNVKSQLDAGYIAYETTSQWNGSVNYSIKRIRERMNIDVKTLVKIN